MESCKFKAIACCSGDPTADTNFASDLYPVREIGYHRSRKNGHSSDWRNIGTAEDANLLAAAIMRGPDIDCDVLFQYCDLREIFEPLGYINVALQYDALPYRKWSSPLDLREIGIDGLSLHEKCDLQLGWELAGKDDSRDRADMSVEELIHFGETEAEERDLEVWLHGYMDPYEGEIDTARYSKEHIIEACEQVGFDIDFSRLPEPEESLDDMAQAAESALEEKKENNLEGEHEEEIPF